jgi:hypothetical protein
VEIAADKDALAALDLYARQKGVARVGVDAQEMGNLVRPSQRRNDDTEDERQHDEDGCGPCFDRPPQLQERSLECAPAERLDGKITGRRRQRHGSAFATIQTRLSPRTTHASPHAQATRVRKHR